MTVTTTRQRVHIVVCGDVGSGKTSLISCLLKERFDSDLPNVLPEISLPAQLAIGNVHTIIQDTPAPVKDGEGATEQISAAFKSANVICLCYAVDQRESFDRISTYWLPLIQSISPGLPVIVVGTKADMRTFPASTDTNATVSNVMAVAVQSNIITMDKIYLPLMNRFMEIETCLECSAKQMINVPEVFYFASKAVLYPTRPLFDTKSQRLLERPIEALTRIFHIIDCNKNGLLDDQELNAFQKKVFGSPLQQQELEKVKDVVKKASLMPPGIRNDCLTLDGFIYLHSLFAQRGRTETTWEVLKKYGYGDSVELRPDFLVPKLELPTGCMTELSSKGYRYFTDLFQAYDQDKDGALNKKELIRVFETTPGNPWIPLGFPNNTITNEHDAVTLQGFLAMWNMTTMLDYKTTLAYLAYLGYDNGPTRDAIKIIYPNRLTSKKGGNNNNRNVFHAYVFGATGSGKTELLKYLVNKPFINTYDNVGGSWVVVNSIEIRGTEKYLVVQEVAPGEAKTILDDKSKLNKADVLCFVYDISDANSFSYIVNLRDQYDLLGYPVIFIGTKADKPSAQQQCQVTPEQYAEQLGVAPPLKVSVKDRTVNELFGIILGVAINPRVAIPSYSSSLSQNFLTLSATAVAGTLALGALWFLKLRHSK